MRAAELILRVNRVWSGELYPKAEEYFHDREWGNWSDVAPHLVDDHDDFRSFVPEGIPRMLDYADCLSGIAEILCARIARAEGVAVTSLVICSYPRADHGVLMHITRDRASFAQQSGFRRRIISEDHGADTLAYGDASPAGALGVVVVKERGAAARPWMSIMPKTAPQP